MALGIQVLSSLTANQVIFDFTATAESLRFSTNRHGFADCSLTVPLSQADAFRLYDLAGAVFLRVSDNSLTAWEGRVEDVRVINGGAELKALGCWRALYDTPYTATWSVSRVDKFRPGIETEISAHKPQLYISDSQNRLQANLKKNGVYASGDDTFYWVYELPDDSATSATYAEASYDYNLPSGWTVQGLAYLSDWSSGVVSNITTSGSVGSGTFTWDLSGLPKQAIGFRTYNTSGSAYTNASEDDAFYFRITSPRVTASGSSVTADEIVSALVTYVSGINSTQLSTATGLIESPGVDLKDEIYEDQYPADILDRLAFIGDTSGSPYEVGVWEGQQLHFRQRGKHGRTWYVDASSLDVERSVGDVWNSAYAVYQETGGQNLRTSSSSANSSIAVFGITRRAAVKVTTTGSAQAEYARNTYLTDNKDSKPRVSLVVDSLYDATGAHYPVWIARSSDTVIIRNLPPTVSQQIDKITSFRLDETEYDARSNTIRLVPESPPPALDVLVARQGVGL